MKVKIGETASQIWKFIQKNGKTEVEELKKNIIDDSLPGSNVEFFSSLGWLLKENKIEMKQEGEKIFVFPLLV